MDKGVSFLITGGAGFIGSHLCDLLLRRGHAVHIVDDLSAGSLAHVPIGSPKVGFDRLKIGDPASEEHLERLVARSSLVFHLASPVGVSLVHSDPGTTIHSIVLAGAQIVELCRRQRRPLLFTSSSEVYGPSSTALSESSPLSVTMAPRSSYAIGKLAVEHMVAALYRRFSVPSWVIRLFNIAGPRQRVEAGVVAAFGRALVNGDRRLDIHGDGSQTRCFLHVIDAAEALLAVAQCAELMGRPVNVGGSEAIAIRELAEKMAGQATHAATLSYHDYASRFGCDFLPVLTRSADTRLLREVTGWCPKRNLSDIIRDALSDALSKECSGA